MVEGTDPGAGHRQVQVSFVKMHTAVRIEVAGTGTFVCKLRDTWLEVPVGCRSQDCVLHFSAAAWMMAHVAVYKWIRRSKDNTDVCHRFGKMS